MRFLFLKLRPSETIISFHPCLSVNRLSIPSLAIGRHRQEFQEKIRRNAYPEKEEIELW